VQFIPQTDIKITHISSHAETMKGGNTDYCLLSNRPNDPGRYYPPLGIGGYEEVMCVNNDRMVSAGAADWSIDLSATPLSVPAGSVLVCQQGGTTIANSCSVDYASYNPGDARYRMLRIPYIDQGFGPPSGTSPFLTSYYLPADANHPLHILGLISYQASYTTMQMCLNWLHQGGAIANRYCYPLQQTGGDYQSPSGVVPIDWTIPSPDLLGTSCDSGGSSAADCAAYVITEIPSDIPPGPENVSRDYNNVPRNVLPQWCTEVVPLVRTAFPLR
jgi:hypothetical protein